MSPTDVEPGKTPPEKVDRTPRHFLGRLLICAAGASRGKLGFDGFRRFRFNLQNSWKFMIRLLILMCVLTQWTVNAAEVIAVDPIEDCFLCSSTPSLTMHWRGTNSKVVLLVIPGGTGLAGISSEKNDLRQPFFNNLKRLTQKNLTKGQIDLVVLDSPRALTPNPADLSGRGTKEHMIRIESAVRYYKQKTGLPVWILGQSNGGASLGNFIRYLQEKNQANLIAGAVASTVRPETNFPLNANIPFMFITHKLDGCRNLDQLRTIYEKVKNSNSTRTEWFLVEGGEAEIDKDPCRSGFHMFYKAGAEYAKAIDDFIASFH